MYFHEHYKWEYWARRSTVEFMAPLEERILPGHGNFQRRGTPNKPWRASAATVRRPWCPTPRPGTVGGATDRRRQRAALDLCCTASVSSSAVGVTAATRSLPMAASDPVPGCSGTAGRRRIDRGRRVNSGARSHPSRQPIKRIVEDLETHVRIAAALSRTGRAKAERAPRTRKKRPRRVGRRDRRAELADREYPGGIRSGRRQWQRTPGPAVDEHDARGAGRTTPWPRSRGSKDMPRRCAASSARTGTLGRVIGCRRTRRQRRCGTISTLTYYPPSYSS